MAVTSHSPSALRRRGAPYSPEERVESLGPVRRDARLEDKYLLDSGRIFLSGIQALVRVPLDQHRADRRSGLSTGTFISGYQGSPLGGLDKELERNAGICHEHHLVHVPGLNEELGATSTWGSQMAGALPGSRYDGVLGMWYGKAPGLDRAADALRHANLAGVARTGGAVALVGDDPSCKSSTLPSASEALLQSLHIPIFFPGDVQDILDLGLHAFACSRASGLWTAMKIVTDVADSTGTAEVAPDRVVPVLPGGYEHVPDANLLAPRSLDLEHTMLGERTGQVLAYARENRVNRIEGARDAWLGIVAAGKPYHDLRQALADLGLAESDLERAGVRILRLGMIWPLEPQVVREFATGLEEILVVEEKRAFVEPQVKEVLYGSASAPRVVGKRDERGEVLLSQDGDLNADAVARAVAARLGRRVRIDSVDARIARLDGRARGPLSLPMADGGTARTPFFCSGCPHNSSTPAPDGTIVGAGIGCHTMILLNREGRGEIQGLTQMGGEGAQWIGMAPFTDDEHFVQNLGDGTFHHSGSLAIRAAAAAGANITYKLFYNSAVAMTGGQDIEGAIPVPELTRLLEIEGVKRIIVTTEDPGRYRGASLSPIAEVRDRSELMDAQRELAATQGVTVLIHDQECAAEKRRKRKRGKTEDPPERIHINERVCEGCGDCGRKSSCLSVLPVETEFGRKTQIHQSSCNKDYTCIEGDCPSFLTVVPGKRAAHVAPDPPARLPDPERVVGSSDYMLRMMGVGGTGVVTVSQILGMAALMDGLYCAGLDQTGLAQKGGPVTSDLRISEHRVDGASRASKGGADLYLGLDLLGAGTEKNLAVADPERTIAVISTSAVPTGRMVIDTSERFPELSAQLDRIDAATRRELNFHLDAQALSERLFGDHMPANLLALGAAFQRGALPLSAASIEQAIRLNGAAVEKSLAAFAWGRACVADPDAVEAATRAPDPEAPELSERERELVAAAAPGDGELRRVLEIRVPELVAYQGLAYAAEYAGYVRSVRERAGARLAVEVALNLFKLMAYKDEYEVARLHLDAVERARIGAEFGEGAKVWFNLHPPLLRSLGMKRKLKLGRWFLPFFRLLRAMRRLRGTPLDPFGLPKVRRVERALPGEYRALVEHAIAELPAETALEVAALPDMIRGYEDIKLESVERFRSRAAALAATKVSGTVVASG
ncbi:MAG TPA: indolepyruvate ferredoxin oxidoreductase family protein [Thermoleophilaceae bacterium]|nr:indolepyruvate ferredoxin oxidoreductase family protein [Thermoleophilaceae bacterium]